MQKIIFHITLYLFGKLDGLWKSQVLKYINPIFEKTKKIGEAKKIREGFEKQRKAAKVQEITDLIKTRHAKIRISERFGELSKKDILDDIHNNTRNVEASKDRRYTITTLNNVYIFSDKHHLITTYKRKHLV